MFDRVADKPDELLFITELSKLINRPLYNFLNFFAQVRFCASCEGKDREIALLTKRAEKSRDLFRTANDDLAVMDKKLKSQGAALEQLKVVNEKHLQSVAERDRSIAERDETIRELQRQLLVVEAASEQRQSEISASISQHEAVQSEVRQLKQQLSTSEAETHTSRQQLAAAKQHLAMAGAEVSSLRQQLSDANEERESQCTLLAAEMQASLDIRDRQLRGQAEVIQGLGAALTEKETALAEKDEVLARVRSASIADPLRAPAVAGRYTCILGRRHVAQIP